MIIPNMMGSIITQLTITFSDTFSACLATSAIWRRVARIRSDNILNSTQLFDLCVDRLGVF